MKKNMLISMLTLYAFCSPICFNTVHNNALNTPGTAEAATYLDDSSKNFGISADNMYLTSLSVLNSLDYEIIEMQSKSGYILFRTGAKDYIMTVTAITPVTSNIKILPANSVYSTGTTVQKTIFNELELNKLNLLKKQG